MSTDHAPFEFRGNERFSIVRRIGAGGMGVVYEAFDHERQMKCALKTLQAMEPNRLHRFKQEFRNFTDVVHPNVAVLHELFSDGETLFFTMELVDGVDFLQYVYEGFDGDSCGSVSVSDVTSIHHEIASAGPEPAGSAVAPPPKSRVLSSPSHYERLRRTLLSLAEGIHALHQAGRLHRDLKPSNVLVTPEGRVVILDFGLGTTVGSGVGEHVREDKISGTISYMSPEQMSIDADPTPASDWYSLGTMMYQALTGRLPFFGSMAAVVRLKRSSEPSPPSRIAEGIPPDLDSLCVDLLHRDPAERPTGPEILRRLGGSESRVAPVFSSEGPLVGRERQLRTLHGALEGTRAHNTVVAFVHGRSGAGKSFLVNRFLRDVEGQPDTDVFVGRCYEAETVPYKALDSLVDSLARYLTHSPAASAVVPRDVHALTRLFPVLRGAFGEVSTNGPEIPNRRELRRRAIAGLREMLTALAERRTIVLCIDDLQWGDVDSANVLLELLRPPAPPRLLLLGVYRSEYAATSAPLKMLLEAALKGEDIERFDLQVEALSQEESIDLARSLLPESDDREERARVIARESGGTPYFIHELVRYTREHPEQSVDDSHVTLNEVLERRFEALPQSSHSILELVSVVGRPLRRGDVFRASGLPPEARAAFGQLRGSSMIRSTGSGDDDTVEVYHDRIRETMVGSLDPATIRDHYGRLARTLESTGGYDSETMAICFRGSGDLDRASIYYERGAAEAMEALAFDRAANLYRLTIELRPGLSAEDRSLLLERQAEALANAGRTAEAASVYDRAVEGASPERAIEVQRLSAYHYCSSGRLGEGRKAMESLLATQGLSLPGSPVSAIARLLWNRALLWHRFRQWQKNPELREVDAARLSNDDLRTIDVTWSASAGLSMMNIVLGAAFQARNLIQALALGEPFRIARAMAWEAAHTSNSGSDAWPRTLELIDAASRLSRKVDNPQATAMVTMARGISEFTMGRFRDAVPLLDEAESIFREQCTGVTWEIDTTNAFELWGLIYQGRFSEASARTAELMKEAEEHGDLYASTNLQSFMVPHARLAEDDSRAAREAVLQSQKRWAHEGFHLQNLTGIMASTLIDLYEGEGASAWTTIDGNWKTIERAQILRIQILRIFLRHFRGRSALEAALSSGSRSPALIAAARKEAAKIGREGAPWARGMALSLESAIASHGSDHELATRLMRQAVEEFDEAAMLSYHAAALRRLGELEGDDERIRAADDQMRTLGVKNPEKMARMHLAGVRIS